MSELQKLSFCYLDYFKNAPKIMWAAQQGAANFTPAMLPKLWNDRPCPYRNPLYREAWYRGFYSCACWYLIVRIAAMGRTWKPDFGMMIDWYCREHPPSDWNRVPRATIMPTTS